jgi:thioesterase domain-containing protein
MQQVSSEEALARLREIWETLLEEEVLPDDSFFDLGGDSLLVVELVTRARLVGLGLKALDVFEHPVLEELAHVVASSTGNAAQLARSGDPVRLSSGQMWKTYLSPWSEQAPACLVPLVEEGNGDPLFVVHSGAGNIRYTAAFVQGWGAGRPVYGFEAVGYRGEVRPLLSVSEIAERYLAELTVHQPQGPYRLAGLCFGGVVAVEMARRLRLRGAEVALVALVNVSPMDAFIDRGWGTDEIFDYRLRAIADRFGLSPDDDIQKYLDAMLDWEWIEDDMTPADFHRLHMLWSSLAFAQLHHEVRLYDGRVVMFQDHQTAEAIARNWLPMLPNVETHWISEGVDRLSSIARNPIIGVTLERELGAVSGRERPES